MSLATRALTHVRRSPVYGARAYISSARHAALTIEQSPSWRAPTNDNTCLTISAVIPTPCVRVRACVRCARVHASVRARQDVCVKWTRPSTPCQPRTHARTHGRTDARTSMVPGVCVCQMVDASFECGESREYGARQRRTSVTRAITTANIRRHT